MPCRFPTDGCCASSVCVGSWGGQRWIRECRISDVPLQVYESALRVFPSRIQPAAT
jgi:hypothetical protein